MNVMFMGVNVDIGEIHVHGHALGRYGVHTGGKARL